MASVARVVMLAAGLLLATASLADAPAGAPAGSTGACKDGSYWSGATKKGACRGHKGVQTWYAEAPAAKPAPAAPAPPAAPAAPAPKAAAPTPPATAAAGGGSGQVWVNNKSKVYHCSGDRWYGKTKDGQYMTEADAASKGFHPDHGKACK